MITLIWVMFIFITSSEYNVSGIVIIMTWFYAQLAGLVCGYATDRDLDPC